MTTRRNLPRLLALLAACCLLPAFPMKAQAPRGNLFGSRLLDRGETIHAMAAVGETLYIRTSFGLYSAEAGDESAILRVPLEEPRYDSYLRPGEDPDQPQAALIFADGERLLGLDVRQQTLYTLGILGQELVYTAPLKLDLSDFLQGDARQFSFQLPSFLTVMDGHMYMRLPHFGEKQQDLFSFNLQTGEKKAYSPLNFQAMAPYRDGSLIAIQANLADAYQMDSTPGRRPRLVVFTPGSDSAESLEASLPFPGPRQQYSDIYYDTAEDSLYLFTDTDIHRLTGNMQSPRLIGYLPALGHPSRVLGGLQPLPGGLALAFSNNVYRRPRDEAGVRDATPLAIFQAGSLGDPSMLPRIMMALDDVTLRMPEGLGGAAYTRQQLAEALITGSLPVDILVMGSSFFDLDKLMDKGYLLDLSGSEIIRQHVGEMAPNLRAAFTREEHIYAVPASLGLMPMAVHPAALEALGLPVPTSITSLIDLAEQWLKGPARQQTEYSFLAHEDRLKTGLQALVMTSYVDNMLGTGQALTFDTPLFRGLMARLEGLDTKGLDSGESWEKLPLIEPAVQAEPRFPTARGPGGDKDLRYLVLPMAEGQPAAIQANASLVVVMAASQHKEAALRFVEALIQAQHPVDQAVCKPEATASIDNPDYEAGRKRLELAVDQLTAQVQQAEAVDKTRLQSRLDRATKELADYEATARYLITAEELAVFHQLVARSYIRTGLQDTLAQAVWDQQDLPSQYMEGAISLDQMIAQLDDKLRLILMENK